VAAVPVLEDLDALLELLARQELGARLGVAQDEPGGLAEGALDLGGVGLLGGVDEGLGASACRSWLGWRSWRSTGVCPFPAKANPGDSVLSSRLARTAPAADLSDGGDVIIRRGNFTMMC
jgi:hypothetical protein